MIPLGPRGTGHALTGRVMITITACLCLLLAVPGASGSETAAASVPSLVVSIESPTDQNATLATLTQFPSIRPVLETAVPEARLPEAPTPYIPIKPVKRAELPPVSPATRHAWIALTVVQHGTAAFDAWSTRQSITSGHGHELNPLMKPFAGSGAMYAATQVAPLATDYLARRLMQSDHPTFRKLWWLPQVASSVGFTVSGFRNMQVASGH